MSNIALRIYYEDFHCFFVKKKFSWEYYFEPEQY